MSESFPEHVERLEHEPRLTAPEQHPLLPEHSKSTTTEQDPHVALQEARKAVAETTQSNTQHEVQARLAAAENTPKPSYSSQINRALKQITLNREIRHLQRKLPTAERLLSRTIHQPIVRAVSEATGQTISRPSGLLGGGLVAFLGTSGYLYLAKHLGFRYNYLVFLVLFAGGFALGLTLELLIHVATRSRRATD